MSIKILINGAFGRMGLIVTKSVSAHQGFTLVGQTGREYDLQKSIRDSQADVVIDFTHPDAVYQNTLNIIDAGARPVIGTTGLKPDQIRAIEEKCAALKRGGIIAPNFSMGAVLMMRYAKEIAKFMPNVEIIEYHHDNKADSPSGTALRTAEMLASAINNKNKNKPAIENVPGARGALYHGIPIHAVRLPGFLAHEQIMFGSTGETLTLRHDSIDRACFMPGVMLACEKVMKLDGLVIGLENIL